jgi:hypothetical protein
MADLAKIFPVYGEGDREAVEGGLRLHDGCVWGCPPSVSRSGCHLPVNGEDL